MHNLGHIMHSNIYMYIYCIITRHALKQKKNLLTRRQQIYIEWKASAAKRVLRVLNLSSFFYLITEGEMIGVR